jgi:hypothetical protein
MRSRPHRRFNMVARKTPAVRIACIAAFLALALALVPAALAGKPGGGGGKPGGTSGGGGTITLALINSTDGLAHFGQKTTFNVSTSSTSYPWVTLKCSQGGALVYQASNGMFATSLNQVFTLGPTPSWLSGDADCTAYLQNWDSYSKNGSISTLASTSFHVYG